MTPIPPVELRALLIACRNRIAAGHRDAGLGELLDHAVSAIPQVDAALGRCLLAEWLPLARESFVAAQFVTMPLLLLEPTGVVDSSVGVGRPASHGELA